MAIRNKENIERKEVVTGVIPPAGFREVCSLRVKEPHFKLSSKDNPMLVLDCEIFQPQEAKGPDGSMYDLTSIPITLYWPLVGWSLQQLIDNVFPKLGLPAEIDDENPDLEPFKGLCFDCVVNTVEQKAQTRDADAPGGWRQLTDSRGNEIKLGSQINIRLNEILNRVDPPDKVNPY